MSTRSKVILALSCVLTTSMIAYVQYTQIKEREDRRRTIVQELQIKEERRAMNLEDLKEQQLLEAQLRQLENAN